MHLYYNNKKVQKFETFYPFEAEVLDKTELFAIVKSDHVMCKFKDNKRANENFVSSDCLYADIDNSGSDDPKEWMTLAKFQMMFNKYEYYIATSKSHQIVKDGKAARDKFHIYFPIKEITDPEKFRHWLVALTYKYKFFDKQVKDLQRPFFASEKAITYYHKGVSIINDLYDVKVEREEAVKVDRESVEAVVAGERNGYLFKMACKYISEGFKFEDVSKMVYQANDLLSKPLDDKELQTILGSAGKYFKESAVPSNVTIIKNYVEEEVDVVRKDGSKSTYINYLSKLVYSPDMDDPAKLFSSFSDASGKKYLFENSRPSYFLENADEFHTRLLANKYCTDFTKGQEITPSRYMKHIRDISKSYERFSVVPEKDGKSDTLYDACNIKPEKNGWFIKMLETMTFETEEDRYKFAAGIISMFMNSLFDGKKPLISVIAPSKSSGKTEAVRASIQIVQGQGPLEFKGDDKDEQQISGLLSLKNKAILYDNLQYITHKQLLNITTTVTDQYIPAWFMHLSHCRVKNNKTFFATFNSENFVNDDVLNRVVVVRMKDGRDTTKERKAEISKLMDGFLLNREKVVADILYYLSLQPKQVAVKRHVKFAKWSEVVSGILGNIFPNVVEFDFSISKEDEELSEDMNMINDFIEEILDGGNSKFVPYAELLERYKTFYSNNKMTATGLGKFLSNVSKSLSKYSIEKEVKKIQNKTWKGWIFREI